MLGALMQKRAPEKIMASPFKLNNNLKNRYFTYVSVGPMVMYRRSKKLQSGLEE